MLAGLTEFKAYLDVLDVPNLDTVLDLVLSGADGYLRTYCGREFESMRRTRILDAVDSGTLWVPEFPLTAVHGITAYTNVLDTTGMPCPMIWVMWYEAGQVQSDYRIFNASFPKSVLIEYTAGYSIDDADYKTLKWICLEVGAQMFRNRGIANMQSYNAGGVQWQKYASDILPMLGPEVMAMLNAFRKVGPRDWV